MATSSSSCRFFLIAVGAALVTTLTMLALGHSELAVGEPSEGREDLSVGQMTLEGTRYHMHPTAVHAIAASRIAVGKDDARDVEEDEPSLSGIPEMLPPQALADVMQMRSQVALSAMGLMDVGVASVVAEEIVGALDEYWLHVQSRRQRDRSQPRAAARVSTLFRVHDNILFATVPDLPRLIEMGSVVLTASPRSGRPRQRTMISTVGFKDHIRVSVHGRAWDIELRIPEQVADPDLWADYQAVRRGQSATATPLPR